MLSLSLTAPSALSTWKPCGVNTHAMQTKLTLKQTWELLWSMESGIRTLNLLLTLITLVTFSRVVNKFHLLLKLTSRVHWHSWISLVLMVRTKVFQLSHLTLQTLHPLQMKVWMDMHGLVNTQCLKMKLWMATLAFLTPLAVIVKTLALLHLSITILLS